MLQLCTMLDAHFVLRGMALLRSLERQGTPFRLWTLCTDDASFDLFSRLELPSVVPFHLSELERNFPELAAVKHTRGPYEYIATAKPFLLKFVLERLHDDEALFYLDADLCFFSDPSAMVRELGQADILLTPHHFADHLQSKAANNGFFNAGFLGVRRTEDGMRAIDWWSERCAEWCYDRVEDGKSSNQKYLEAFPALVPTAKISAHPGLNVAPWNIDRFFFSVDGHQVKLQFTVPSDSSHSSDSSISSLVFYHFHALRFPRPWLVDTSLALYHMRGNAILTRNVYAPYLRDLHAIGHWLRHHGFAGGMGSVRKGKQTAPLSPGLLASRLRKRQWLVVLKGRVV